MKREGNHEPAQGHDNRVALEEAYARAREHLAASFKRLAAKAEEKAIRAIEDRTLNRTIGHCDIGQHVRSKDYVLLLYKGIYLVGPIIRIANEEMARDGLEIVLRHLRGAPPADSKPISFKDPATKKEMFKLKREHLLVSLVLSLYPLQDHALELKLCPMHGGHGWRFTVPSNEARVLRLPRSNAEFMAELAEALEIAT